MTTKDDRAEARKLEQAHREEIAKILKTLAESSELLPQHVADLEGSGITKEQALAFGVRSITDCKHPMKLMGWSNCKSTHAPAMAILFPTFLGNFRDDFCRLKLDTPRILGGKPQKYENPVGNGNRPYFPRGFKDRAENGNIPYLIAEGEKKALKGFIELKNYAVLGVAGCWNWTGGNKTGTGKAGKKAAPGARRIRVDRTTSNYCL